MLNEANIWNLDNPDDGKVVHESLIDIFGFEQKEYKPSFFANKAKFGRDSTLDEDILSLIKKWRGKPQETLVRHMVDSLIIFNHNRNQVDNVNTSDRFGSTEVREAIQLQLHGKK